MSKAEQNKKLKTIKNQLFGHPETCLAEAPLSETQTGLPSTYEISPNEETTIGGLNPCSFRFSRIFQTAAEDSATFKWVAS